MGDKLDRYQMIRECFLSPGIWHFRGRIEFCQFLTGRESFVNERELSRKDRKIFGEEGESMNKGKKKGIKVPDAGMAHQESCQK